MQFQSHANTCHSVHLPVANAPCGRRPSRRYMMMTLKASEHDLGIGKEMLCDVQNIRVFCDMAYVDNQWQALMLSENNVQIITPIKRKKGQETFCSADKLFSRAVSSVKQAIESLNNWLIKKTNIQRASKMRSVAGLTAFIFARIACACFWL